MMRRLPLLLLFGMPMPVMAQATAEHDSHHHHNMSIGKNAIVMNENTDTLPRGCDSIAGEQSITIRAGRAYASEAPGTMFGMSKHEVHVEPCNRVTVTFINEDEVRHQWMVHGLPKYLYSAGMFHLEAMGGHSVTGTFIVPAEDRNYLIHCDLAQHMEKGMRGQLVVGKGSGDLWAVNGITDAFFRFPYLPNVAAIMMLLIFAGGFVTTMLLRKD